MTETRWLACKNPAKMLDYLRDKASDRKLRLFACACARHILHLLNDDRSREAVIFAERYADTPDDLDKGQVERVRENASRAAEEAKAAIPEWRQSALVDIFSISEGLDHSDALAEYHAAATAAATVLADPAEGASSAETNAQSAIRAADTARRSFSSSSEPAPPDERAAQAALLRDLFGNPFQRIDLEPAWRTATVLSLAQTAYDERILPAGELDPMRLTVLADALEEAGCSDQAILDHLRGPGPHVRGCWAVDLLLIHNR